MTVSTNEKNAKLGQKGSRGGHVTHFWNFGTPLIFWGMNKARNFKFGTEMDGSEYLRKTAKLGQKGVTCGSRDPLFGILGPP